MTLSDLLALFGIGGCVIIAAALAWFVVWALCVLWEVRKNTWHS